MEKTPATPAEMTSAAPAFNHSQPATSLAITRIKRDQGIQQRATMLDNGIVSEYTEALKSGTQFPPVVVFKDDADYWLADGYHRIEAADDYGLITIRAEIRSGGRRDAILFAVGANRDHGLRRTREDVRRSVETMLRDQEWGTWSDRAIAEKVGCSPTTVGTVRSQLSKLDSCAKPLNGISLKAPAVPIGCDPAPEIEEIDGDSLSGIRTAAAALRDHRKTDDAQKAPAPSATEKRVGRDGKSRTQPNTAPATKPKAQPRPNAGKAMIAVRDALAALRPLEGMLSLADARTLAGNYRAALERLVARFPELADKDGEGRNHA